MPPLSFLGSPSHSPYPPRIPPWMIRARWQNPLESRVELGWGTQEAHRRRPPSAPPHHWAPISTSGVAVSALITNSLHLWGEAHFPDCEILLALASLITRTTFSPRQARAGHPEGKDGQADRDAGKDHPGDPTSCTEYHPENTFQGGGEMQAHHAPQPPACAPTRRLSAPPSPP